MLRIDQNKRWRGAMQPLNPLIRQWRRQQKKSIAAARLGRSRKPLVRILWVGWHMHRHVEVVRGQDMLKAPHDVHVEVVRHHGHDDDDQVGALPGQVLRGNVRPVVQSTSGIENPLPRLRLHPRRIVEDAGNRRRGDAGLLSNVIDGSRHCPKRPDAAQLRGVDTVSTVLATRCDVKCPVSISA